MPDHAPEAEARAFAASFRSFLDWIHQGDRESGERNPVAALVADFLGPEAARTPSSAASCRRSSTSTCRPPSTRGRPATAGPWTCSGVLLPQHYRLELQEIVSGESLPRIRLTAPALVDLPNGPDSTLGCLKLALLLASDARGRYVLMVQSPSEHQQALQVEVAGLPVSEAQAVLAELDQLRAELNVYRGHLLDVTLTPMGGIHLAFAARPALSREDVVLPEAVLGRVERHALGVAEHRQALLAVGQHLKRGLLLYGPPGTGKTHTTRYLLGRMTGYTRLVITGRALMAVGAVTEMARDLQPSVVVLEDVDLVAEDRSMGPRSSPVLFDLLDAMDGAAADADLLFLLTTNRADLLEPALAARPGRVDVAVEIELPDAAARERLLALYGRGVPLALTDEDIATAIERTDGTTASFLKELIRRSVLEALHDPEGRGAPGEGAAAAHGVPTVTGAHLARALDDLLDSAQGVTRTLLGVGVDPDHAPGGRRARHEPGHGHVGPPRDGGPRHAVGPCFPRLTRPPADAPSRWHR